MTVDYKEYMTEKMDFISKHDHDYELITSPMDDYGCYYKTYCFKDGAIWYEKMSPEIVPAIVEIYGARCKVDPLTYFPADVNCPLRCVGAS